MPANPPRPPCRRYTTTLCIYCLNPETDPKVKYCKKPEISNYKNSKRPVKLDQPVLWIDPPIELTGKTEFDSVPPKPQMIEFDGNPEPYLQEQPILWIDPLGEPTDKTESDPVLNKPGVGSDSPDVPGIVLPPLWINPPGEVTDKTNADKISLKPTVGGSSSEVSKI